MKKLVYQVSGMLLLVGLSASPGLARGTLFNAAMLCNGGGSGSASIKTNGDVKINVKGLEVNKAYTCQAICQCGGDPPEHIVDQAGGSCTTNANGRLNVTFPGAAAGFLCKCPSVEIFDGQDCISGFDLRD